VAVVAVVKVDEAERIAVAAEKRIAG